MKPDKYCKTCLKKIVIEYKMQPKEWEKRIYCCRKCSQIDQKKHVVYDVKHCLHCGGEIARRPGETTRAYEAKKYCSVGCANTRHGGIKYYKLESRVEFWEKHIRNKIRCDYCGRVVPVEDITTLRCPVMFGKQVIKHVCEKDLMAVRKLMCKKSITRQETMNWVNAISA